MDSRPCLVSILCTAYNHEDYIRQALEGFVSQQTDFAFEVLVNDDLSTDGTADIIREYEAKYPDIIRAFYQKENLYSQDIDIYKVVFFPNARGKYLAYCEGDDYWTDPTKLQRQVDFLEAHPEYSGCVHNTMLHFCDSSAPDTPLLNLEGERDVELENIIPGMNGAYHTSSLVGRKEFLSNPPDFYEIASQYGFGDYPDALWLRINGRIRCLDRVMSVYRLNSTASAWSTGVDGQYAKLVRFFNGRIEMLKAFRKHTPAEMLPLVDRYILQNEFDLLYTQGRDAELRKPPYAELLKAKPFSYRLVSTLKCTFPSLHKLYRKMKGYGE